MSVGDDSSPTAEHAHERVLVVVESKRTVSLLTQALAAEGWSVLAAGSGEEALAIAAAQTVDVIVCDLHMPRLDGLEVMRRLHAVDDAVPFVMLTGDGDLDIVLHAVHAGVFDFVRKGPDNEALVGAVARALARARIVRENHRLGRELLAANEALALRGRSRA